MKTTFAIIGFGSIGKRHAAVIEASHQAELKAVCDTDSNALQEALELYPEIEGYSTAERLTEELFVDIVVIAVPHHLHERVAILCCEHKFNVLVEKPMALSKASCERMNEAAKANQVNLWVVKQNRFNVPVKLTKDALYRGMLGEVFMVKCDILWNRYDGYYNLSPWRGKKHTEGGALYTLGSHFIDLLLWWFGDLQKVTGFMDCKNHSIEIEDIGSAALVFKNGVFGQLNWTTCVYNKNLEGSITILGERGTIKIGGKYLNKIEYWNVEGYPLNDNIEYVDRPNIYEKYQGTSSNHDKVIHALCEKLGKDSYEIVDGIEGMKTIEATELIYRSIVDLRVSKSDLAEANN